MGLGEDALQLLELRAGEGGPDAPLLPLLVQAAVVGEELVGDWEGERGETRSGAAPKLVQARSA